MNKIDRPDARIDEINSEVFDLLVNLGADDDDVDYPIVYTDAIGRFFHGRSRSRQGYAMEARSKKGGVDPDALPG